jgi:light-regulated signal transduction histidine kinase (bacteriophytochrome)
MAQSLSAAPAIRPPDAALAAGDAQACAREPIHRLGTIQPNGALLVLDQDARTIRWASSNLAAMLGPTLPGIEAAGAIGAPVAGVLPAWLNRALARLPADAERPRRLRPPRRGGIAQEIFAHRGDDGLVVEFIAPTVGAAAADAGQVLRALEAELAASDANPFRDAHALADAAQRLTGHERAMVYQFRPDWSGEVIAEVRAAHLMPFLGLRFPASDIPAQARALYMRNKVRVTVDAAAPQVKLLPTTTAPDLGMAVLRSVSPTHLAYLGNMGVRSSLVASILVDDQLWGMLACHHDQPSLPPAAVRAGLEALADAFAPAVRRQRVRAAAVAAQQAASAEARLALAATRPGRLLPLLLAGPDNLMQLCDADGVAWTDGAHLIAAGTAPPPAWIRRMLQRTQHAPGGATLLESTSLGHGTDHDIAAADSVAGMLAASLPGGGMLALFREEFVHEVAWGGNPAKPMVPGPDGSLGPRTSFALWRESVRGTCRPWREADRGILLTAARLLAEASAAVPELGGSAWDEFARLGARGAPGTLRLSDLLPRTEAVAVTDGGGDAAPTLFVSDALLQLLGAGPLRPDRRPWRDIATRLGIAHAFGPDGQVQRRDIEAWSADRGLIGLAVRRAPLLQLEAPTGHGAVARRTLSIIRVADQTRASRAAEAMDAAEARSARMVRTQDAMLRNLTHELRAPVHAIMGLAELIVDADTLDDVRTYGAEVSLSARHLLEVIDAMLDLARIEAGQLAAEQNPIDLARVVRDACAMGAPLFATRSIRFAQHLPDRPVETRGDARMLRQAILNLLANAAKFTPPGGQAACALAVQGETATITVSDSGPGIAPALQQKIFEPFFQAEDAARHHGGLGLGLFIARTFVGLHGGRISLASQPGEGATFRIDLPLVRR